MLFHKRTSRSIAPVPLATEVLLAWVQTNPSLHRDSLARCAWSNMTGGFHFVGADVVIFAGVLAGLLLPCVVEYDKQIPSQFELTQ